MIEPEFSDDDFEIIQQERIHNEDYRIRQRMQILYLKCMGYSHQVIADISSVHLNTVTHVLKTYHEAGLLSVISFHYPDRTSLQPYKEDIEKLFEKEPPNTLKEASRKIKKNVRSTTWA